MSPPQMPTHGAREAGEGVARLQEEDRGAEREREGRKAADDGVILPWWIYGEARGGGGGGGDGG
jgi:hypothetical protein